MSRTIDLIGEFSDLSRKEQMVAFLEFCCQTKEGNSVNGLCKVAKPGPTDSSLNYIGLFFIFDIEDRASWASVNEVMDQISDGALKKCCATFDYSVSGPIINPSPSVYIKQLDLVFRKGFTPDIDFIENDLCPAICARAGLKHEGFTRWQEPEAPLKAEAMEKPGFLQRIKGIFKRDA